MTKEKIKEPGSPPYRKSLFHEGEHPESLECTNMEDAREYWNNLYAWVIHSFIDSMKDVAKMMKTHIDKILNYFTHRIANAREEGINSKIALIEKMAYGHRNKEHLKTAIHFRCGNLDLYP